MEGSYHTLTRKRGLQAIIRVRNLDGGSVYERRLKNIDLPGNAAQELAKLPELAGLSPTYFVELALASPDGKTISRNVYWLPTQGDELDWANSNWYLTPLKRYADLTALQSLPAATSEVQATLRHEGTTDTVAVTLSVPASARGVALFQQVSIRQSADGEFLLPVLWSDNDVTLWPGESLTLTAQVAASQVQAPVVEVKGWNLPAQTVPIAIE